MKFIGQRPPKGKAPMAKANGEAPEAKDKGKALKAEAKGKAPRAEAKGKAEKAKDKRARSGTSTMTIMQRLHTRAEKAETALKQLTAEVLEKPTTIQAMAVLAQLSRPEVEMVIERLRHQHPVRFPSLARDPFSTP